MASSEIKEVKTNQAPKPVGPYSQAIIAGEWLYCSGQIPLDPQSNTLVGQGNIEEETRQVIKNLNAVLNAAGIKPNKVVKTTIYLIDLKDFDSVNKIYEETFKDGISPARACVQVSALPKGCRVEIDCIAWLG